MESNNINETLGIENSEKKEFNSDELYRDEIQLKKIADFILVVGIISAILIFLTILDWYSFITAITTLLFSIGVWGFLKVISNISISLKDMRKNENQVKTTINKL